MVEIVIDRGDEPVVARSSKNKERTRNSSKGTRIDFKRKSSHSKYTHRSSASSSDSSSAKEHFSDADGDGHDTSGNDPVMIFKRPSISSNASKSSRVGPAPQVQSLDEKPTSNDDQRSFSTHDFPLKFDGDTLSSTRNNNNNNNKSKNIKDNNDNCDDSNKMFDDPTTGFIDDFDADSIIPSPRGNHALPYLLRWVTIFVNEDEDDRDIRAVKIALTFLDAGTIICGLMWGALYLIIHSDIRSAATAWSFCVISLSSGAHFAATKRPTIAAPAFVFAIGSIPTALMFTRDGIGSSGAVVLWAIVLAPIASLLLLLKRSVAWAVYAVIAAVVCFVAVADSFFHENGENWNRIALEGSREDSRFRHAWYAMNIVCSSGLGFAALDHFWSRWRCERARSEQLLHTVYPKDVLRELQKRQDSRAPYAVKYDKLAVLFLDICQFTSWASQLDCEDMVASMSEFVTCVNENARKWGVELVKNIGDASLIIAGRPEAEETYLEMLKVSIPGEKTCGYVGNVPGKLEDPFTRLTKFALDIVQATKTRDFNGHTFSIRVGISVGETIAGVIGTGSGVVGGGAFDVFGDNVNRAARLESAGTPGHVHCSKEFGEMINNDDGYFDIQPKGSVNVKGIAKAIDTVFIFHREGDDLV